MKQNICFEMFRDSMTVYYTDVNGKTDRVFCQFTDEDNKGTIVKIVRAIEDTFDAYAVVKERLDGMMFSPGDEVVDAGGDRAVVTKVANVRNDEVYVMWNDGTTTMLDGKYLTKTGANYPEIVAVLRSLEFPNEIDEEPILWVKEDE